MHRRPLALLVIVVAALFASVSPAHAADGNLDRGALRERGDLRIGISGGVIITADEVVNGPVVSIDGPAIIDGTVDDNVYAAGGRVVVRGEVTGDILVLQGNVVITGRVGGDVIALDGRVTVRAGARVGGDVTSRQEPNVAPGTVRGDVDRLDFGSFFAGVLIAFLIVLWIAVTLSVAILGLLFVVLFPRAADATAVAGRKVWPTLGWGALIGIGAPIIGVILASTIIGIPLGAGIFSGLHVLAPLGYVASSLILGRLMVKSTSMGARIGAFFAGFAILRAAALIPVLGFGVWFVVCVYGIGALARAAWRAGRRAPEAPPYESPPDGPPSLDAPVTPPAPAEPSPVEAPTPPTSA